MLTKDSVCRSQLRFDVDRSRRRGAQRGYKKESPVVHRVPTRAGVMKRGRRALGAHAATVQFNQLLEAAGSNGKRLVPSKFERMEW
jgi:hypothetical protein